jgi:hypothetical protein
MGAFFTCSIDDAHPADLRVAELLEKHGLPGTFYFPINNSEGAPVLSCAAMREIAQHFEIGSHTLDHRFLTSLDDAAALRQITLGKAALEDRLGGPVRGFCYPGGRYRRRHVDMVRAAGFDYARTTLNLCIDAGPNRYEMGTSCQFYPHVRAVYLRNFLRGGYWRQRGASLLVAAHQTGWDTRMSSLFHHAARRHGVFHLWAHSADIVRWNAWGTLECLLADIATHVPFSNRLNNQQLANLYFPSRITPASRPSHL